MVSRYVETPLKDIIKKRLEIYTKLGGIITKDNNDLYCINAIDTPDGLRIKKDTILVFKSERSNNVCGVGIFSLDGKMRMAALQFSDKTYDAAKEKDIIDVYIYNPKTNSMVECVCKFYNRHTQTFFNILTMPQWYTNIEIVEIDDIGGEEIKF